MTPTLTHCPQCGTPHVKEPERFEARALRALAVDLEGCPEDGWRFFQAVWCPDAPRTVKRLAYSLAVSDSSLITRFKRAGLPSPKLYLVHAHIARALALAERGMSFTQAAQALGFSSSQSFSRTVREYCGTTPRGLHRIRSAREFLMDYRVRFIIPHRQKLREFSPLRRKVA